jgi:integrase
MGDIIKRNGSWTLRWYEGGRRKTLASKQASHAEARRMLLEIEARVARGEAGISERRTSWPTVAELIEQFLQEYSRPKLKNLEEYRRQARSVLKRCLPTIGQRLVSDVKPVDIVRVRTAVSKTCASGSVRLTLAYLNTVFGWAVKDGLAPHNPCKGVDSPTPAQSLDYLSRVEVQALLDAAERKAGSAGGRTLYTGIAIVLYTGLRKGELFGLRWMDLDLDTLHLTVARSYSSTPKSGKARHLRLPAALVPIVREWRLHCPASDEGLVIPRRTGPRAMLGLPRLMQSTGLRAVIRPWHQLRHTFASHFVMNGGNILALQKILGHSDLKMTMIYAHLAPDFLDGEMEKVRY